MKSIWQWLIFLFHISFVSLAQSQENYTYEQTSTATFWQNVSAAIENLIVPNLFGATMLLALSAFFSSINFYKDIPAVRLDKGHRVGRYLAVWIVANYIFALLFLLLILPDDVSLSNVDKTLFVYCLIATALPELAANIKLSLGKKGESIDLYKYKEQLSTLISDRAKQSCDDYRSQQIVDLSYYYYDRTSDFQERLAVFESQAELSDEENNSLEKLKEELDKEPVAGQTSRVLRLQRQHMLLVPKLLRFFENDICKFNDSPVAELMKKLGPRLRIHEARALVDSGITSSTSFLVRCHVPMYRSRLVARTDIDRTRLDLLYHSTRFAARKRRHRSYAWLTATFVVLILTAGLFSWHEMRTLERTELPQLDGETLPQTPIEFAHNAASTAQPTIRSTDTDVSTTEPDE